MFRVLGLIYTRSVIDMEDFKQRLGKLHIVEKQVNEESMRRSSCFLTFIQGLDYRKKSCLGYGLSRYWRES